MKQSVSNSIKMQFLRPPYTYSPLTLIPKLADLCFILIYALCLQIQAYFL